MTFVDGFNKKFGPTIDRFDVRIFHSRLHIPVADQFTFTGLGIHVVPGRRVGWFEWQRRLYQLLNRMAGGHDYFIKRTNLKNRPNPDKRYYLSRATYTTNSTSQDLLIRKKNYEIKKKKNEHTKRNRTHSRRYCPI